MLYRPKFCCNCGEKIERIDWNLLTSRRFCAVCVTENRAHDILPRAAVTTGVLALMFSIGSLWAGSGRAESTTESAVGIKTSLLPTASTKSASTNVDVRPEDTPIPDVRTLKQTQPDSTVTAKADKNADVYFCGALTKKGTPCSRKVKGRGLRCYQHEGRPEAPSSE